MTENIVHANEKYARDIGFDYGGASDAVQAELLNGLARGLRLSCGGKANVERQLYYIVDGLDRDAKDMIREFAAYIEEDPR